MPRLRMWVQAPSRWLGAPRWTVDNNFDLTYHLRRARVREGGSWDDVMEFSRTAAMADFDRSRPLWEFTLLAGLSDGGAAFVTKLHHSLSDGIGGVQLAALVIDGSPHPNPQPPGSQPAEPEGHRLSQLGLAAHGFTDEVSEATSTIGHVVRGLPGRLYNTIRHPLTEARDNFIATRSVYRFVAPVGHQASGTVSHRDSGRTLATIDLPVDELRGAAHAAGCHLNDAYLAALTEGVRRYHAKQGETLSKLQVTMPISLRQHGDPVAGNRITLVRLTLAASIDDACERMQHISKLVRRWRHEPAMAHTQKIARGLTLLPRSYLGDILKRIEVVASDVPGIPDRAWLAGARITAYYGFGPTIGSAFNATLMSYAGTCNIGINIDTSAIEDPESLIACLQAGFADVMRSAASV